MPKVQKSSPRILLLRARPGAPINKPQNSARLAAVAFISSRDLSSEMNAPGDFLRRTFAFFASRLVAVKVVKPRRRVSRSATFGVRHVERRLAVVRDVKEHSVACSNLAWGVTNYHNYYWPPSCGQAVSEAGVAARLAGESGALVRGLTPYG